MNPQQMLPLTEVALEAHALGHPKGRDQAPLDLLAELPTLFCERYLARFGKALTLVGAVHCPYVIETSFGQSSRLD